MSEKSALHRYAALGRHVTPHFVWGRSRWIVIPFSQPREMVLRPVDLFQATFVAPPVCPARFVLTVCELGFERHPDFYPRLMALRLSTLSRWGSQRALRILSISEYTKRDLMEFYGIPEDRICVVHLGVSERFTRISEPESVRSILQKHQIYGDYVLYVGKIECRKNIPRLLRAYHQLGHESHHLHKLVIAGIRSYLFSEVDETIRDLQLEKDVLILENVDAADLPALYNGASAFVFPSLLEGFGIPPIEALACGTPVIVSNVTAMPEVAGDAAVLVNPYNTCAIAEGLETVLTDEGLRQALIAKGLERARHLTWQGTAEKTLAVYQEVCSSQLTLCPHRQLDLGQAIPVSVHLSLRLGSVQVGTSRCRWAKGSEGSLSQPSH